MPSRKVWPESQPKFKPPLVTDLTPFDELAAGQKPHHRRISLSAHLREVFCCAVVSPTPYNASQHYKKYLNPSSLSPRGSIPSIKVDTPSKLPECAKEVMDDLTGAGILDVKPDNKFSPRPLPVPLALRSSISDKKIDLKMESLKETTPSVGRKSRQLPSPLVSPSFTVDFQKELCDGRKKRILPTPPMPKAMEDEEPRKVPTPPIWKDLITQKIVKNEQHRFDKMPPKGLSKAQPCHNEDEWDEPIDTACDFTWLDEDKRKAAAFERIGRKIIDDRFIRRLTDQMPEATGGKLKPTNQTIIVINIHDKVATTFQQEDVTRSVTIKALRELYKTSSDDIVSLDRSSSSGRDSKLAWLSPHNHFMSPQNDDTLQIEEILSDECKSPETSVIEFTEVIDLREEAGIIYESDSTEPEKTAFNAQFLDCKEDKKIDPKHKSPREVTERCIEKPKTVKVEQNNVARTVKSEDIVIKDDHHQSQKNISKSEILVQKEFKTEIKNTDLTVEENSKIPVPEQIADEHGEPSEPKGILKKTSENVNDKKTTSTVGFNKDVAEIYFEKNSCEAKQIDEDRQKNKRKKKSKKKKSKIPVCDEPDKKHSENSKKYVQSETYEKESCPSQEVDKEKNVEGKNDESPHTFINFKEDKESKNEGAEKNTEKASDKKLLGDEDDMPVIDVKKAKAKRLERAKKRQELEKLKESEKEVKSDTEKKEAAFDPKPPSRDSASKYENLVIDVNKARANRARKQKKVEKADTSTSGTEVNISKAGSSKADNPKPGSSKDTKSDIKKPCARSNIPQNFTEFPRKIKDDREKVLPNISFATHKKLMEYIRRPEFSSYADMKKKSQKALPDVFPTFAKYRTDAQKSATFRDLSHLLKQCCASEPWMRTVPNVVDGSKFQILKMNGQPICIGAGQYGLAVLAQHEDTQDVCIIKIFKQDTSTRVRTGDHFFREVTAMNKVYELFPHLVPKPYGVFKITDASGLLFDYALAMEYVSIRPAEFCSVSLSELVTYDNTFSKRRWDIMKKTEHILPKAEWYKLFHRIVSGLKLFADNEIVHMDIKQDNILVRFDKNGVLEPVFIDLGLTMIESDDIRNLPVSIMHYTHAEVQSYFPWIAPECVDGNACYTSDLYSVSYIWSTLAKSWRSKHLLRLAELAGHKKVDKRIDYAQALCEIDRLMWKDK